MQCDDVVCATATHFCCVEDTGSRPLWECMVDAPGVRCGALTRQCDEAADCPAGQLCCVPLTARPFPAYSAHCAASCDGSYWFQLCRLAGECPAGKPCLRQECSGESIQTCGAIEPLYCNSGR